MKLLPLLCSCALVALPCGLLASGCGGGSNGLATPTNTPAPTSTSTPLATSTSAPVATATSSPTATTIPTQTASPLRFALSDGRVVTVRLQLQGRRAFGVLETPLGSSTRTNEPAVPFLWDGGNYALDGTFTPPQSVNVSGQLTQNGASVPFTLRGTLPTQSASGPFTLSVNGRSVRLTFPATGAA